jgi:hypothetical protein
MGDEREIVAFLRARLDELEAWADGSIQGAEIQGWHDEHGFWLLGDVEAKRRIIDKCDEENSGAEIGVGISPEQWLAQQVMRLLALPYADHPDYRQEWKLDA